ncbi:MAG: DUF4129 domain-containing protein [Armatimonadota bacterium]
MSSLDAQSEVSAEEAAPPLDDDRTDLLTEVAIPLSVMGLLSSFLYYLLELRSVFWGSESDAMLRWVCFFFLMGTIGVTRLRTRYGDQVIAAPYMIGLAAAIGVFVWVFTQRSGPVVRTGLPAMLDLLFTYAVVAVIWYAASRLTRECTAEETRQEAAEHGMLEGMVERGKTEGAQPEDRRSIRHPGWLVMYFSLAALVVFALGERAMTTEAGGATGFAFTCMAVYAFFALLLLALTTLSSIRMYVRRKRLTLSRAVSPLWITLALLTVAGIVLLATKLPRAESREPLRRIAEVIPSRLRDREADRTMPSPIEGTAQGRETTDRDQEGDQEEQPRPEGTPAGQEGPTEAADAGPESTGAAGSEPEQGETSSQGREGEGAAGAQAEGEGGQQGQGEGEGPEGEGRGEGGAQEQPSSAGQTSARQPPSPLGGWSWLWLLLLLLLAVLGYLIYRYRKQIKAWFERLTGWKLRWPNWLESMRLGLLGLLARIAGWLGLRRLAALLSAGRRGLPAEVFVDPFRDRSLADKSPAEKVKHVYRALLAYADLLGCGRLPEQTPFEYLRQLPRPLSPIAKEANQLTYCYVQARYTPEEITQEQVAAVRGIWTTLQEHIDTALAQRQGA